MAESPDNQFFPEDGEGILSSARRLMNQVVFGATGETESLAEKSRQVEKELLAEKSRQVAKELLAEKSQQVGMDLAHGGSPYRDSDVRDKQHYTGFGPRGVRETRSFSERDSYSAEGTEEDRRALARMMTRSRSNVTLELEGLTGGVRQRHLFLPPLPSNLTDGAAADKVPAAGAGTPQSVTKQPQSIVSVVLKSSEQPRSDDPVEAGKLPQQQLQLEPAKKESATDHQDQRREGATERGDDDRHPSPAHSHQRDMPVDGDASFSQERTAGQQDALGAIGGEDEFTLPPW